MCVDLFFVAMRSLNSCVRVQIPIKAGHEFIVSTEDKYAESGDDKVLYMDYVSARSEVRGSYLLTASTRKTCQR